MAAVSTPIEIIEDWKRKAFNFSSKDRLGNVISRSLEVLKCLAHEQIPYTNLEYALDALEMENNLVRKYDNARHTDELRALIYGMIESILTAGTVIKGCDKKPQIIVGGGAAPIEHTIPEVPPQPAMPQVSLASMDKSPFFEEPTSSVKEEPETYEEERFPSEVRISSFQRERSVPIKECDLRVTSALSYSDQFEDSFQDMNRSQSVASPTMTGEGGEREENYPEFTLDQETSLYKCKHCNVTSKWTSVIEQHIRVHTGERPYPCDVCGKKFSRRTWLVNHMTAHSSDPDVRSRFNCSTCGMKFTDRSNLRRHIRKQHEPPMKCEQCNIEFEKVSELKKHMKDHIFLHGI